MGPRITRIFSFFAAWLMWALPASAQQLSYDSLAGSFVKELNALRADPASYLPRIEEYRVQVQSFTPSIKKLNKAVSEIKTILAKQSPLLPLTVDSALMKAAADHVADAAATGILGHIGSSGSNPGTRVARYGLYRDLSEAITYGHLSTALMLASFLVDEGTPDRGHRKSVLASQYTKIGVAIGYHPKYDIQLVVLVGN
ncbi:MAG: CAP domain-containing protein [Chlorobi bacterium]|nr:MAG: CAP domain-containing protein [Bacteroidota bacterium]KXK34510.1 MAG: Cysteine-rich secretory protein family protein [Chlorobi bacterium OLB6]MBE2264805.1 CAP domain-containing protein [Flavobacteriales bacterium]MBL1160806.1 CAP domain-containing protein [Chlorobiota bacterium]MBW7852770.1 CAP domain-containing protein [Candidatus Kapabacteria bacterium]MCC6330991.1 CAP domain-containing protein [Ignavibacteria bacterium]